MKTMTKAMVAVAGVGVLGAGVAFGPAVAGQGGWGKMAGHGGKGLQRMLRSMDADDNGELTLQELEQGQARRFDQADANGDGQVTADEMKAQRMRRIERRMERRIQRQMRRLDENRDGVVSKAEFVDAAKQRFTWADLNDDGTLTRDELPRRGKGRRGGGRY
ncbi:MAG: EF-hand domain-containing protein [Pseudomonadota bacterium]